MKLEIITAVNGEYDNALPSLSEDSPVSEISGYYTEKLSEAAAAGIKCLDICAVEVSGKISGSFQRIYNIEKPLMEFLGNHLFPQKVRVICKDDEQARMYKVVYNYFYADTHEGRMEVEHRG